MNTHRFALIYGIVFLVVGVAGFIPGITAPHTHPEVTAQTGGIEGLRLVAPASATQGATASIDLSALAK